MLAPFSSALAAGPDVTRQFLEDNDLELIVRSHEVQRQTRCSAAVPMLQTCSSLAPLWWMLSGTLPAALRAARSRKGAALHARVRGAAGREALTWCWHGGLCTVEVELCCFPYTLGGITGACR
jgi:hypothetical protein